MCRKSRKGINSGAKSGLGILYVKPNTGDSTTEVSKRDLDSELREQYWIQQAKDAANKSSSCGNFEATMQCRIERRELGRNRNQPGDGFRYVYHCGTHRTGGRAEWFEVAEIFEGVEPKDVKAFIRVNNGGEGNFERDTFLKGLDMGTPCRAAQRRAADKVIAKVEEKMNKPSYEGLWRNHGYGTLIVGLPLWFATYPKDPLRVENVLDDFMTRVLVGLMPYARRLRKKNCPFWRIAVVWQASMESMREWVSQGKLHVYDDPVYNGMEGLPIGAGSMAALLLKLMGDDRVASRSDGRMGAWTKTVVAERPNKKAKETLLQLPRPVEDLKAQLAAARTRRGMIPLNRLKLRARGRFLDVRFFVRVHGLPAFQRWAVTRLSPRNWIARLRMRRRARKLYQASLQRQGTRDKRRILAEN